MKISLLSLDASLSYEQRLIETKTLVEKSAIEGARLVLLPELSYCGYTVDAKIFELHSFDDGLEFFCALARKYNIYIGFGAARRVGKKYKNSYVIVSNDGKIVCIYDKIHLFSFASENTVFDSGERLSIFELDGLSIGISICYDLRFPEIFSLYANKCDIALCPSAWPKKRVRDFRLLLKARAIENRLNMLGINWLGGEYIKSSLAINDKGLIQKSIFSSPGLDIYEISKKDITKNTPNSVADKRFDLYAKLIAEQL